MRRTALLIALSLVLLQSSPVSTQPFDALLPRQPTVLNGCTENALFAVLNTDAGRECLRYLPTMANVGTQFSVFCRAGRWGCCDKTAGYPNCKIEEAIPFKRKPPPVAIDR